ncbi:related to MDM10-mitochondrial morphology and inheritance component [Sporisorium scitamineum]|uniref:Related to MDM10-mitochondrial morphology and inheritance component n=1 Tax=Sporisorium scitamineum TaxID=49012 RepID=A0A0F7SBN7_9BASI|nr:related to MDM10-mitochondrial morphology and inheritance component [Sporisorium scitamineum]CDW98350.1 hypothetical protein [Sporisorium scitamineum]
MSSLSSSSGAMSTHAARSGDADVKLERSDVVGAVATATTHLLQKARPSCSEFLLAFQNGRFCKRMIWSFREKVGYHNHITAAASASAERVVQQPGTRITSDTTAPTSPEAFLRHHKTSIGKQRMSFVCRVDVEPHLAKGSVVEFSLTCDVVMVIKRGSTLYKDEDFRKMVKNGSLVNLSGLLRGKRNGEDCLAFDGSSTTETLSSARLSDVRRFNANLGAQVYRPHRASSFKRLPAATISEATIAAMTSHLHRLYAERVQ